MRVVLKDRADQTLMLVEATDVTYDREDLELYFYCGDCCYVVKDIPAPNANAAIQALFESGKVDLTHYASFREVL